MVTRKKRRKNLSATKIKKIKTELKKGVKPGAIADKMNIARNTVYKYSKQMREEMGLQTVDVVKKVRPLTQDRIKALETENLKLKAQIYDLIMEGK